MHSPMNREERLLYPLAAWAAGLSYDAIPEQIRLQAKLSLLDTLGCIVAGSAHPDCRRILHAESRVGRGSDLTASVAMSDYDLSFPVAAKVNSAYASILELDDNTSGHASLVTVPVGLAVAESHHISGRELLTAMVATYEAMGRILEATFDHLKPYAEVGMIPISGINTIGSATLTALLLGADADGVFEAINAGLAFTPFTPIVNAKVGASIKPLVFGAFAAFAGVYAALDAAVGITGADDSYESEYGGWLHTIARSWDEHRLRAGLGETWFLEAPNRKRHACCGYTHSSIDGAWSLLEERGLKHADIATLHVTLPKDAYGLVGTPALADLNANGAKFSLPYVLAVALAEARPISPDDTTAEGLERFLADPEVRRLMDAVSIDLDDAMSEHFGCRLTLTSHSGAVFESFVPDAVGRGSQQFTIADIEEKFRSLTTGHLPPASVDRIVDQVLGLDGLPDVAALAASLRG